MSMSSRLRQRLARTFFGETLVLGTTPTLLADLTDVSSGEGICILANNGAVTVFYALTTSATTVPALTANNGIPLPAGAKDFLDAIGGLAVWGIVTVNQTAGSGTRVSGGKP